MFRSNLGLISAKCSIPSIPSTQGMEGRESITARLFHTFHTFHTVFTPVHIGAHTPTRTRTHAHLYSTFIVWKVWKVWKSLCFSGSQGSIPCVLGMEGMEL
jgi:hypothetical protein